LLLEKLLNGFLFDQDLMRSDGAVGGS